MARAPVVITGRCQTWWPAIVACVGPTWQYQERGDRMTFDRITVEPEKLEGKPSVRGLRITVETVVRLVAAGWTFDEILAEYPDLEREDIRQALEYAAASANVHVYRLREPA
jgi:uncharacterized protein (DUF433 family)